MRRIAAIGLLCASLFAPDASAQQKIESLDLTVTTTPAVATDYLFRGISQTRSRPALQLGLDVAHGSGFYVGAFGSNVAFMGARARQEVDALAGYRFEALSVQWDIGAIYYAYPGFRSAPGQFDLDYTEVMLKATREIDSHKLLATLAWSPDFFGRSGTGIYVEGGADIALPMEFTLAGRIGHQWIQRNVRFGAPDYLNWSIAISRPLVAGFTLAVGYYDTNVSRAQCGGGQTICAPRAMVTLSRPF